MLEHSDDDAVRAISADADYLTPNFDRSSNRWPFKKVLRLTDALLDSIHHPQTAQLSDPQQPDPQQPDPQQPDNLSALVNALEETEIAIVSVDFSGRVLYCNSRYVDLWQLSPGILSTRRYSQYVACCRQQIETPDALQHQVVLADADSDITSDTYVQMKDTRRLRQASWVQRVGGKAVGRTWGYAVATESTSTRQPLDLRSRLQPELSQIELSQIELGQIELSQSELDQLRRRSSPTFARDFNDGFARNEPLSGWLRGDISSLALSGVAVFVLRRQQVTTANAKAETLTGYSRQEMQTHPQFVREFSQIAVNCCREGGDRAQAEYCAALSTVSSVSSGAATSHVSAPLPDAQLDSVPIETELSLTRKSGEVCWLSCSVQMFVVDGEPFCLISAMDVTALKQQNARSSRLIAAEFELAQQRSRITEKLVHRTLGSLNLISMSSDLLAAYGANWTPSKKQPYLNKISTAVERLSKLVQTIEEVDLMTLSAVDVPNLQPSYWDISPDEWGQPQWINVHGLCHSLIETFKDKYDQHAFVTFCFSERPQVYASQPFLQTVLSKLLDGISASTASGLIRVTISQQADGFVLTVSNMGLDLLRFGNRQVRSLEPQETTFQNLVSKSGRHALPKPETKLAPSTASGSERSLDELSSELSLVRALLTIIKGNISIESVLGRTVVTVRLPLSAM